MTARVPVSPLRDQLLIEATIKSSKLVIPDKAKDGYNKTVYESFTVIAKGEAVNNIKVGDNIVLAPNADTVGLNANMFNDGIKNEFAKECAYFLVSQHYVLAVENKEPDIQRDHIDTNHSVEEGNPYTDKK